MSAFACDRVELEGAVGVKEVGAVLPDELALDAFRFSCCFVAEEERLVSIQQGSKGM